MPDHLGSQETENHTFQVCALEQIADACDGKHRAAHEHYFARPLGQKRPNPGTGWFKSKSVEPIDSLQQQAHRQGGPGPTWMSSLMPVSEADASQSAEPPQVNRNRRRRMFAVIHRS